MAERGLGAGVCARCLLVFQSVLMLACVGSGGNSDEPDRRDAAADAGESGGLRDGAGPGPADGAWAEGPRDGVAGGPDGPGDTSGSGGAGGARTSDGGADASGGGGADGALPGTITFASPAVGADLLGSAVVDLVVGAGIDRAEIFVVGEATPRCALTGPFRCLIDLGSVPEGAFSLTAQGTGGGKPVTSATIALSHRLVSEAPCPSSTFDPASCVNNLVTAGTAAGYTDVYYHDMDNGHAQVTTSGMPGIQVKVNQAVAGNDPWHTDDRILVGNQSQVYSFGDGTVSIPRLAGVTLLGPLWERGKMFLWPEHHDHGVVDFYSWQTPVLSLSQGSSGSEVGQATRLLYTLAALPPEVRAHLHSAHLLMPALAMIHRRANVASDLEYLSPAAHETTLVDRFGFPQIERTVIRLAQAVRDTELPPVARLTVVSAPVPPSWATAGVFQREAGPYALVWAASTAPAASLGDTLVATLDLSSSQDANGRPLYYFARVVRGDPTRIRVTEMDAARFRVEVDWPASVTALVGGKMRSSRRATVAFFAHNGVWPSAPAFLSVFGGAPQEHAPDSNDLD